MNPYESKIRIHAVNRQLDQIWRKCSCYLFYIWSTAIVFQIYGNGQMSESWFWPDFNTTGDFIFPINNRNIKTSITTDPQQTISSSSRESSKSRVMAVAIFWNRWSTFVIGHFVFDDYFISRKTENAICGPFRFTAY